MLPYTVEPLGISYPSYISALVVACGMPSGATGRHLERWIHQCERQKQAQVGEDTPSHFFNKCDQVG